MGLHAPLPPSSASRWAGQCPGSVPLERANPEDDTQEAKEGHAAHHIAADTLRSNHAAATGFIREGAAAPNGVIITGEMLEAADMFVEAVNNCGIPRDQLHIEEAVANSYVHPDNWGTPDVWGMQYIGNFWYLHIPDFKFGHRYVDAFENLQCLDYAGGVLSRPEFAKLDWALGHIVVTIVQPRNFHPNGPIRKWVCSGTKLNEYLQQLREAATEALGPNPRTLVGPECRDCRGRHQCEALHRAADSIADYAGTTLPVNLPPNALGVELRALQRAQDLLKSRITGLEEQAKASIKRGERVSFYSLKQGETNLKWKVPASTAIAAAAALGVKIEKDEPAVMTPTQAKKLGMNEDVVNAMAGRDPGEMKLIQQDASTAGKVFGTV